MLKHRVNLHPVNLKPYKPYIYIFRIRSSLDLKGAQKLSQSFVFYSTLTHFSRRMQVVSIHLKNLRFLLIEAYKIINRESPSFLLNMFELKPSAYSKNQKKFCGTFYPLT